ERGTLEEVMRARNAATASPSAGAEAALGGALGRLMAVAEAYPDLKASQNFTALQDELSDLENKIAAARRFLNSATNEYNTTREQFPANIVASMFDFESRETVVIAKDSRVAFDTAPSIRF
ncbi:MAG: LemA family protein, partial [Hyphomicrobiaceae bacterium]